MESDKGHVHLLVDYPPDLTVVSIVRRLKSMSTIRIWERQRSFLLNHFWREKTFWSDGYFAYFVGDASAYMIRTYVDEQ
jgi:putative transposase